MMTKTKKTSMVEELMVAARETLNAGYNLAHDKLKSIAMKEARLDVNDANTLEILLELSNESFCRDALNKALEKRFDKHPAKRVLDVLRSVLQSDKHAFHEDQALAVKAILRVSILAYEDWLVVENRANVQFISREDMRRTMMRALTFLSRGSLTTNESLVNSLFEDCPLTRNAVLSDKESVHFSSF